MKNLGRLGLVAAIFVALAGFEQWKGVKAAGGPAQTGAGP